MASVISEADGHGILQLQQLIISASKLLTSLPNTIDKETKHCLPEVNDLPHRN